MLCLRFFSMWACPCLQGIFAGHSWTLLEELTDCVRGLLQK